MGGWQRGRQRPPPGNHACNRASAGVKSTARRPPTAPGTKPSRRCMRWSRWVRACTRACVHGGLAWGAGGFEGGCPHGRVPASMSAPACAAWRRPHHLRAAPACTPHTCTRPLAHPLPTPLPNNKGSLRRQPATHPRQPTSSPPSPQTKAAYAANLRDLEAHRGALDAACEAILERETLMGAELEAILAAHPPAALPGDDDGNGSGNGPEGRQPAGALA